MSQTLSLSPLTRVEGHLDIQLTLDKPDSMFTVTKAQSSGTMFRGFENILMGRDPRDATHYTQRICGVCPVSHAMAATLTLEQAFAVVPPDNGRILRNLILGANFLQSHVLHFYHLAAPDYIDTTGILDMPPWKPRFVTPDMVAGGTAKTLVGHYVQALAIRRKAHQMGAIFAGRMPGIMSMVPGGCTSEVTTQKVTDFKALLTEIQTFINNVYLPDVLAVAAAFPQYSTIGKGCGNLLAYGVFDLNAQGTSKLLARGRYTEGNYAAVDLNQIKEYVKYSYYTTASGNRNPSVGITQPSVDKAGAYSWVKAPRYAGKVHEVGPLARMWVNGDYRKGISVIDRVAARAYEAKKVADAMAGWLTQLRAGASDYTYKAEPASASGIGLTEAPRGALGHWMQVASKKISRYQIITPTAWNASPEDDNDQAGAIEQALTGLRIADIAQPIEALRVVHSFDPCLSCSVHFAEPKRNGKKFVVHL
ncbi:MAG: nickel-dependent hydrogenase large subunit [Phycisphaerae bacterium]